MESVSYRDLSTSDRLVTMCNTRTSIDARLGDDFFDSSKSKV